MATSTPQPKPPHHYRKHFIPLESNPEVFTELIHKLGATNLHFEDVFTLDDIQLLQNLLGTVHAFILVIPTTQAYEKDVEEQEKNVDEYDLSGEKEEEAGVVFFKQTINNACGWYAVLHGLCNGSARELVGTNNALTTLLSKCTPLGPHERALAVENDAALEAAYASVARKGDTEAPEAEAEVDYHYICFVKSLKNGHLYQLDGDRKRPIDLGDLGDGEGVLSEGCLRIVRDMIKREEEAKLGVNLMALVSS
ncbi:ubiquitin C-terminal hydrolase L3 [Byssothecium circinans]|uniref:Ubiquitin carboxyl-terminal hydrolase n=1 Tax=Byssothecium circinans TaxID=147558 RepID=A0A6A5TTI9_9PLEO|nr:ubiquitin C-terminal hydrolase L3 [Byssothecium circinans]